MIRFIRINKVGWISCLSIFFITLIVQNIYAQGKGSDPIELTFSVLPSETGAMTAEKTQPLINYIAKKTGKKVAFYLTTSYAAQAEAMMGGFVDIAMLGPSSYVIAKEKDPNIEVFAALYRPSGHIQKGGFGYHCCLITAIDGKYDKIDKLRGTILALTDPSSASGYLVPKIFFPEDKLGGEDDVLTRLRYWLDKRDFI